MAAELRLPREVIELNMRMEGHDGTADHQAIQSNVNFLLSVATDTIHHFSCAYR